MEERECKHRLKQAVQNRILARKGLKPRESVESPFSPKDRAHLYADGHGRFVNFQDEHLFREEPDGRVVGLVATRALRIFQSRFRTDRINKAARERERERVSRLISCRIELDFQVECVSARNRETRTRPFDVPHDLSLSPFVSISWPR